MIYELAANPPSRIEKSYGAGRRPRLCHFHLCEIDSALTPTTSAYTFYGWTICHVVEYGKFHG